MSAIDNLLESLNKEIGKNSDNQAVSRFINTGYPPLNKIVSGDYDGGLPFGRMMEVFGDSSTGKTALATQWMINAQKMGGIAIFIDWEKSFDVGMASAMGLNTERPYWIYNKSRSWEEGNILAAKACEVIRKSKTISDDAPIIVIFDSIAAAKPQSSAGKSIDSLTMNDTTALARVTSTTLKYQAEYAEDFGATFVYLNQTREAIGVMFGSNVKTPGGKAMEFYSTVRLSLSRQRIMQETGKADEKEMIGQNIVIKCVKSKLTAPFKSCSLKLSFDDITGMASFDEVSSLVDVMIKLGVFPSRGWIDWEGRRYNGKKQLIEGISESGEYQKLVDVLKAL